MTYNKSLEDQIEDILHTDNLEKKKMFGGICYLINGNMCFGIWKDYLIVRMAPEMATEKLKQQHVKNFDLPGKPMKGWAMIEKGSWKNKNEITEWLDIGMSYALTLPKKLPKRKSLEEIYYRTRQ